MFLKTVVSLAPFYLEMVVASSLTLNTCLAFVVTPIPWFLMSCFIRSWGAMVSRPWLLSFAKKGLSATGIPLHFFSPWSGVLRVNEMLVFMQVKSWNHTKKLIVLKCLLQWVFLFQLLFFSNSTICKGIFYLLRSCSTAWLFFTKEKPKGDNEVSIQWGKCTTGT